MTKYKRIFTIVVDSLGVGALPDAAEYGDMGTDTLGHIEIGGTDEAAERGGSIDHYCGPRK